MMQRFLFFTLILLTVAACRPTNNVVPTVAEPDAIATGIVLTENAPPTGFETVSFPQVDANLGELAGWRYEMEFEFIGRFAGTSRDARALTRATVTYNQLASARRVIATVQQDLQGENAPILFEAARLGPDTFLLIDNQCVNSPDDAALVADLSAGDLLGGISTATTAAKKQIINGENVWLYNFETDALRLANIGMTDASRILSVVQELWVSPEHNAVVRYYVTVEAENISVFASTLPVSGTLIIRYDLYDIGIAPPINIPFGC